MIVFPNCKINLGLSIIEKRNDGFHNIETVFYPIPLYDVLEIILSRDGNTTFNSSGISIPGNETQNLCLKAYHLLKENFDLDGVEIYLHKAIPMGAGLGGGSSDAAHTLILLNDLFKLKLDQEQLLNYASKLGADCAFFILNKPSFAFERGDQFKALDLNLEGYHVIIVKPEIHVGTAEAYAGVSPGHHLFSVENLIGKPIDEWRFTLKNDFEKNIFANHPEIETIKNTFYENGAIYTSMSGSGSSVFGLFKKSIDLSPKFKHYFYWSSKI